MVAGGEALHLEDVEGILPHDLPSPENQTTESHREAQDWVHQTESGLDHSCLLKGRISLSLVEKLDEFVS